MLPCMQNVGRSDIHLSLRSPELPMTQLLSCANRPKLFHTPQLQGQKPDLNPKPKTLIQDNT